MKMTCQEIKIYILANELLDQRTKEGVVALAKLFGCSRHTIKRYRKELKIQNKRIPSVSYKGLDESPEFKALKRYLLSTLWVNLHV